MPERLPLGEGQFLDQIESANAEFYGDSEWSFTDAQERAILHGTGPLHITAGPGSGKTEVLASRTLKLLMVDEVRPKSIFLTTFTEKAAQNLEERIIDRLDRIGYEDAVDANELRIGTIHSLCKDIMQEYRYKDYANVELLDEDAQQLFMYCNCDFVTVLQGTADLTGWETVRESTLEGEIWEYFNELRPPWEKEYSPNKWEATEITAELFNRISQYRTSTNQLRDTSEPAWWICAEGLDRYCQTLREGSRCDFARLLERFIEFLDSDSGTRFLHGEPERNRPPLEHVLVDEYQDTNPLQQELYFRLVEEIETPNVTVVGDDDQALYRFRGGTVECLIQFPDRVRDRFNTSVTEVQLRTNYRSTDDVVSWCNRYISQHPLMQLDGARAPGKEPMLVGREGTESRTSVRSMLISGERKPAEHAAALVKALHERSYVDDYSQIAFLFKSTRESSKWAGHYVDALRDHGVPVHNPRNKSFLERPEIKFVLGALIRILDPEFDGADADWVNLQGDVRDQVEHWVEKFDDYVKTYNADELDEFVQRRREDVQTATDGESLEYTALELVYRIVSFAPFQEWIEGSEQPERGKRLGRFTKLFDSFASVTGPERMQKSRNVDSVSTGFLDDFYWTFCGYLESSDFDEPEDPHDQLPAGFVQVMTTHQAKGLEFPIVFVCGLDDEPWTSGTYWMENELAPYADIRPTGSVEERAERDEIRRFYVSYSRAEEDLVLIGPENAPTELSLGYEENGNPFNLNSFDDERQIRTVDDFLDTVNGDVGPLKTTNLKRRYSITGDVLAYKRCKRQYGYYNELGFTPNHVTQLFFGRVVHETLDRAHRHYAGELEGVEGGEPPTGDDIQRYFDEVAEALKSRNIYPMSQDAEDAALEYLQRFNRREADELYPRVVDTEHRLQSNREEFVLEGVVDVLVGQNGKGHEVWDYKAGQRPNDGRELDDYEAQLHTYAELYRYRQGEYPDRGIIYFLGEESKDEARLEIEFEDGSVEGSIDEFEETVEAIESDRQSSNWFDITPDERPSEATCVECDIRHNCPARPEYQGSI